MTIMATYWPLKKAKRYMRASPKARARLDMGAPVFTRLGSPGRLIIEKQYEPGLWVSRVENTDVSPIIFDERRWRPVWRFGYIVKVVPRRGALGQSPPAANALKTVALLGTFGLVGLGVYFAVTKKTYTGRRVFRGSV